MNSGSLTFQQAQSDDQPFIASISCFSQEWSLWELGSSNPTLSHIEKWMNSYHYKNGEWRIWSLNEKIAFTYHLTKDNNDEPWLGTIVVNKKGKGMGRMILEALAEEERKNGAKVLYTACPVQFLDWMQFLGKVGFEQYKVDYDEKGNEYLLLALPL
jgi:GNAT superfamily N-acetyltransferase